MGLSDLGNILLGFSGAVILFFCGVAVESCRRRRDRNRDSERDKQTQAREQQALLTTVRLHQGRDHDERLARWSSLVDDHVQLALFNARGFEEMIQQLRLGFRHITDGTAEQREAHLLACAISAGEKRVVAFWADLMHKWRNGQLPDRFFDDDSWKHRAIRFKDDVEPVTAAIFFATSGYVHERQDLEETVIAPYYADRQRCYEDIQVEFGGLGHSSHSRQGAERSACPILLKQYGEINVGFQFCVRASRMGEFKLDLS